MSREWIVERITGEFVCDDNGEKYYELEFKGFRKLKDRSWANEKEVKRKLKEQLQGWEIKKKQFKERIEIIETTKEDEHGNSRKGKWIALRQARRLKKKN